MDQAHRPETGNLLLVEDDRRVMRLFASVLSGGGYRVWEASSGQTALDLAREKMPDLVLLDVGLPDLSGLEVCRQIKADAALTGMLVVMVSGEAIAPTDKVEGLGVGADDYLIKPVDLNELVARVATWVRLRRTSAALRASEEHYRQLVAVLPDAVGVLDLRCRFVSVNPRR